MSIRFRPACEGRDVHLMSSIILHIQHHCFLEIDTFPLLPALPFASSSVETEVCSVNHRTPGFCRKPHMASKPHPADLVLKAKDSWEERN